MRRATYLVAALAACWPQMCGAQQMPLLRYEPGVNPQAFVPISYRCPPDSNKGSFELTKMSAVGARIRMRVTFEGERPTYASLQRSARGAPFSMWHEFNNPGKQPDNEAERNVLQTIFTEVEGIRLAICMGVPATREKYDQILEHNRLQLWAPND